MTTPPSLYAPNQDRRQALLDDPDLTGIDSIEVSAESLADQLLLRVHMLSPPAGFFTDLEDHPERVEIRGGVRVTGIRAVRVERDPPGGDVLLVEVDKPGDFSLYTLALSGSTALDPVYCEATFSFKAGCPSPFDCRSETTCSPEELPAPVIDYLAKDYASFRQALHDLLGAWRLADGEHLEAGLLGTTAEILAYAGDQLSYYQDVVANESFLDTARLRPSIRRHALLVDYPLHEGVSARVFAHFEVSAATALPDGLVLLPKITDPVGTEPPPHAPWLSAEIGEAAAEDGPVAFLTRTSANAHPDLNEVALYAWGESECSLPADSTEADLEGDVSALIESGDYLLLEETRSPENGDTALADPTHRQVVRVVEVETLVDRLADPDQTVTRVTWHPSDALGFPLCIASGGSTEPVGVARGNIVLADHGRPVRGVDASGGAIDYESHDGRTQSDEPEQDRAFRVTLEEGPLSFTVDPETPDDAASDDGPPAVATLLEHQAKDAVPEVEVVLDGESDAWTARRHLLDSREDDRHFVAEMRNDGRAVLRFGDGVHGREPTLGAALEVSYRVGVGRPGNVGADSLAHAFDPAGVVTLPLTGVRNPLPGWGGVDAESLQRVRELAPRAFQENQPRAVTPADYVRLAELYDGVAKAVGSFRWTGSWYTVFLAVDPAPGTTAEDLESDLPLFLDRFRLAGYDVEIAPPAYVPLEIELDVCVDEGHFRADVQKALLERLSSDIDADGSEAFFHPDNFTFGDPLYLGDLYAACEEVEGVESVSVRTFKRLHEVDRGELEDGLISIDRLEIAQLTNDVNSPEEGTLRLNVEGGR